MSVVTYKNSVNGDPAFNNLLSDLFPQFPSVYREQLKQTVPVNIKETADAYVLDVAAPGFSKEDFKVNLENNLLTIAVDKKDEVLAEGEKSIRREFRQSGFKRSFSVDDKINTEAISAQYTNGILRVTLPKKEEVKPATKQITIL